MSGKWQSWKKWTGVALGLLLLADIALAGYLWQLNRQGPEELRAQRDRLATQAKLLKADVARGEKIRASLPQVKKSCDAFYNQSFLDRITGYSDIETDLDSIAAKAGVKTSGFSFKQKEVKGPGRHGNFHRARAWMPTIRPSSSSSTAGTLEVFLSAGRSPAGLGLHGRHPACKSACTLISGPDRCHGALKFIFSSGWASCWPSLLYRHLPRRFARGSGVLASDSKFQPLDVQEPRLHTELLERIRKLEYSGTHRNIFVAAPPPPRTGRGAAWRRSLSERFVGPQLPPPPPPLQVPAEFFGYATRPVSGKRVAFFTSGDDVLVVPEGDTFLGRFRLIHIGNDSADVEEIATGPPRQSSSWSSLRPSSRIVNGFPD